MSLRKLFLALCATAVLLVPCGSGDALWAHAQGEDYVFLNFRADSIDGLFEIHFDDLRQKLALDLEQEAGAAQRALDAAAPRIRSYIEENFAIGPPGGAPYALTFTHQDIVSLPQGGFARFHFRADTGPLPNELAVRHEMLYEGDRLHRGLLLVEYNAKTDTTYPGEYTAMVFSPGNREQVLDLVDIPGLISPRQMIWQGMLHIWIGIDHILFLLALLLPTVLRRREGEWEPVPTFGGAFLNLLKIVTVFTVAHSATLLLAALDFVTLPSRLVESVIALSIVLVAVNNVTGTVRDGSLVVVAGLGLFHGLGFASVMGHLPFRVVDLLRSVIGFNIGVELGQLAIVAVVFPILYLLREQQLYRRFVLPGASALLVLIAGWWFLQRALGLG